MNGREVREDVLLKRQCLLLYSMLYADTEAWKALFSAGRGCDGALFKTVSANLSRITLYTLSCRVVPAVDVAVEYARHDSLHYAAYPALTGTCHPAYHIVAL